MDSSICSGTIVIHALTDSSIDHGLPEYLDDTTVIDAGQLQGVSSLLIRDLIRRADRIVIARPVGLLAEAIASLGLNRVLRTCDSIPAAIEVARHLSNQSLNRSIATHDRITATVARTARSLQRLESYIGAGI
jgi:hypothetical protein